MKQGETPRYLRAGRSINRSGRALAQLVHHYCQPGFVPGGVVLVKQATSSCLVDHTDCQAILASGFFGISFGAQVSDGGPIPSTERSIAVALYGGGFHPFSAGFMLRHWYVLSNYQDRFRLASKYSRQYSFVNQ